MWHVGSKGFKGNGTNSLTRVFNSKTLNIFLGAIMASGSDDSSGKQQLDNDTHGSGAETEFLPQWLNRRIRKYDDGRPLNKVSDHCKMIFTFIFSMIGIHAIAKHDGYPADFPHMAIMFVVFVGFILFSWLMQVPERNTIATFFLGVVKMFCLLVMMVCGIALIPIPWGSSIGSF